MSVSPSDSSQWYADNGDHTLRLNYPLEEDALVIDIGGYIAEWSHMISNLYDCNIYIFEPTHNIEQCKQRLGDRPKIKFYQSACFTYDGKLDLGFDEGSSSIFNEENKISVDCIDFNKFLVENNINHVDLVKINVEGAEYDLLDHMIDGDTINYFDNIQVQFHLLEDSDERYEKLAKRLSETHELTWRYPFVWENWTRKSK